MGAHLHHVGVATDDAEVLAALYGDLLGLRVAHAETFRGMRVVFLSGDGDAARDGVADGGGDVGEDGGANDSEEAGYLELLEPIDAAGDARAVARFLDRRGSGLHHVAFAVDDLRATLEYARARQIELLDSEPRPGAWGHRVAFLHPESTGGVLIELVG